ncbi:apolipo protein O-domain-containing protein [Microdochium trichocladiopsis]|uniref:MICOS complex subunit n=1 Tax=Microdochium trichocladiopsis TaxID=1682393 RepID=A0A9P8YDQ3_9PEZI|nr:apolipo protein O-domain-containing protein [Microdochium trichocladiopsis]KAH7035163.1 apolipo protein O-domain-containing protein [Microdochium trichocladiopsis]
MAARVLLRRFSRKPIYDDYEPELPKADTPVPSPASHTIPQASGPESSLISPSATSETSTTVTSSRRGPTPTDRLAVQIGKARMFLYHYATKSEDAVNSTIDKAFHLEKSFTETVASLAPSRESGEKLMPGLVYVLVAGMAGSIVTRNRNILLRATVPLALGIGAGWALIPVTMTNVSDLTWKYESKFPVVADAHLRTRESIQRGWRFAKVHADLGKTYVDDTVSTARDTVEDWVKKGK